MNAHGSIHARRFLHCCYCCDDVDAATTFLTDGLGLNVFMQVADGPFDGSVLGLDGLVEANVCFAYDHRGPRIGPGIEVQGWVNPIATGEPHTRPWQLGVQSLGIAVGALDLAAASALRAGASVVGHVTNSVLFDAASVTVRDANRITFDLIEDAIAAAGTTRIAHLRINCSDLHTSVQWYERLGFRCLRRANGVVLDPNLFGEGGTASFAELVLPDEPMRLLLVQWLDPSPIGAHYPTANHRGIYRVAVGVDDTRAATRELEAAGVVVVRQPELLELKGTAVPDMWISFLTDPDGVPVELVERPRSAFR